MGNKYRILNRGKLTFYIKDRQIYAISNKGLVTQQKISIVRADDSVITLSLSNRFYYSMRGRKSVDLDSLARYCRLNDLKWVATEASIC